MFLRELSTGEPIIVYPGTVTGLLFSELNAVFAAKHFIFFISPILLKLGKEENDPTPNDRTTKR